MARLRTDVPRARRGRTTLPGAAHPNPLLDSLGGGPTPYSVFGPGGLVHEPGDSTAEKLAPGPKATRAAATVAPPSHSGGNSGNLSIPGYTPSTPVSTVPYSPTEPGHSAEDFAKAEAAKAHKELIRRSLAQVAPLAAPTLSPLDQLGQALGGALANPLGTAAQVGSALIPKPSAPSLLGQLPEIPKQADFGLVPQSQVPQTEAEIEYHRSLGIKGENNAQHPSQTVEEVFDGAKPKGVAGAIIDNAQNNPAYEKGKHDTGPADLNVPALKGLGYDPLALKTQAGSVATINQYLHEAGWKANDPAAQRKALGAFYGTEDAQQKRTGKEVLGSFLHPGSAPWDQAKPQAQDAALYTPAADPRDPLGGHTLGNVTQQQLLAAARAGTLQKNGKGQLTTPEGRQLLHGLLTAHKGAEAARALPKVNADGSLEPNEIGALLVEEGKKLGLHLTPEDVAEGIGVAEAESSGDYAANTAQIAEEGVAKAHIGLYSEEEGGFGDEQERLNPRTATNLALQRFAADGGWYDAWVKYQAAQGEDETGSTRAPQYAALAKELVEGGKAVDPTAVKLLTNAQHAASKDGINPTPWNGDVQGGSNGYVTIRADAKGALNWAESAVGVKQGEPKQLHWAAITHGPEDPWCSEFVGAAMARQGFELPEDTAYSGSWLNWKGGKNIGTDISKVKPGDILVFGTPEEAEHVGLYKGDGEMISGNFSNEVAKSEVSEEIAESGGLLGIVRPKYKGGTIKVKAGSLPGSSPETTAGVGSTGTSEGGEVTSGAAPAETVPAAATSSSGAATREAALANFTGPAAPNIGGNIFESGQPSEAEEAIRLLTQASARSRI